VFFHLYISFSFTINTKEFLINFNIIISTNNLVYSRLLYI